MFKKKYPTYDTDHGKLTYLGIIELVSSNPDSTIEIEKETFSAKFMMEEYEIVCKKARYESFTVLIMMACLILGILSIQGGMYIITGVAIFFGLFTLYLTVDSNQKRTARFLLQNMEAYRKLGHILNAKAFDNEIECIVAKHSA